MFSLKWISGFLIGSFPLVGVLSFSTAAGAQTKTTRLSIATGGTGGFFTSWGGDRILPGEKGLAVRSWPKINKLSEHSSPAVSLREIKDHREKGVRVPSLKSKGWLLLLPILVLISVGGAFLIQEVRVLQIVNTDRSRNFQILVKPASRFTLSYINSIYLEPAAEEFEVGAGEEIILRGVRTKSPAVAHYYGFEDGREYYPVNRKMKSFVLRVGMSIPQTLDCGNRKISLQEMGEKGDRLEMRVVRMTLAHYLLSTF